MSGAPRADILVIDPPWKFASNSESKPGRNAMRHYPCMTDDQIKALPIADLMSPNALLFVWVTVPMLERAMDVARAWKAGRYVSNLTWQKSRIGNGFWIRNRHEHVLLYRRGKFPCPSPAPFGDSVIVSPTREHSRKPDELQARIDEVWPDAVKLEMFARQEWPDWYSWGNQRDKYEVAE